MNVYTSKVSTKNSFIAGLPEVTKTITANTTYLTQVNSEHLYIYIT